MASSYRKPTTWEKDDIAEERDTEYVRVDDYKDIIDEIESDVNEILDMLEEYDPRNESLSDIVSKLKDLSLNLY